MHVLYIDIQSCVQRHLQSAHVMTASSSLLKVVNLFCTILLLTSMVYPCWEGFLMLCVAHTPSNVCWCQLINNDTVTYKCLLRWYFIFYAYVHLVQVLVDSLHGGKNIPTVLQSLGCMAQHSISAFEARDKEITSYINETYFQVIDEL